MPRARSNSTNSPRVAHSGYSGRTPSANGKLGTMSCDQSSPRVHRVCFERTPCASCDATRGHGPGCFVQAQNTRAVQKLPRASRVPPELPRALFVPPPGVTPRADLVLNSGRTVLARGVYVIRIPKHKQPRF